MGSSNKKKKAKAKRNNNKSTFNTAASQSSTYGPLVVVGGSGSSNARKNFKKGKAKHKIAHKATHAHHQSKRKQKKKMTVDKIPFTLRLPAITGGVKRRRYLTNMPWFDGSASCAVPSSLEPKQPQSQHPCLNSSTISNESWSQLDDELWAFAQYVQLTPEECLARDFLIDHVDDICQLLFCNNKNGKTKRKRQQQQDVAAATSAATTVRLQAFGSYATRDVCTYASDVDLALWGVVAVPVHTRFKSVVVVQGNNSDTATSNHHTSNTGGHEHEQLVVRQDANDAFDDDDDDGDNDGIVDVNDKMCRVQRWKEALAELDAVEQSSIDKPQDVDKDAIVAVATVHAAADDAFFVIDRTGQEQQDADVAVADKKVAQQGQIVESIEATNASMKQPNDSTPTVTKSMSPEQQHLPGIILSTRIGGTGKGGDKCCPDQNGKTDNGGQKQAQKEEEDEVVTMQAEKKQSATKSDNAEHANDVAEEGKAGTPINAASGIGLKNSVGAPPPQQGDACAYGDKGREECANDVQEAHVEAPTSFSTSPTDTTAALPTDEQHSSTTVEDGCATAIELETQETSSQTGTAMLPTLKSTSSGMCDGSADAPLVLDDSESSLEPEIIDLQSSDDSDADSADKLESYRDHEKSSRAANGINVASPPTCLSHRDNRLQENRWKGGESGSSEEEEAYADDESGSDNLEVSFVSREGPKHAAPAASAPVGPTGETRKLVLGALKPLGKALWKSPVIHTVEVRRFARVPIIATGTHLGFEADVAIGGNNGTDTSHFASSQAQRFQSFSPVVLLLKVLLAQQALDKPFTGGLGSYKLYVLVAHHLEQHLAMGGADRPSEVLVTFFYRFRTFRDQRQGGAPRNGRSSSSSSHETTLSQSKIVRCSDGGCAELHPVFKLKNCCDLFEQSWSRLMQALESNKKRDCSSKASFLGNLVHSGVLQAERDQSRAKAAKVVNYSHLQKSSSSSFAGARQKWSDGATRSNVGDPDGSFARKGGVGGKKRPSASISVNNSDATANQLLAGYGMKRSRRGNLIPRNRPDVDARRRSMSQASEAIVARATKNRKNKRKQTRDKGLKEIALCHGG